MLMLPFASMQAHVTANAAWVDYLIIGLYFVVTLAIGFVLRRRMRTPMASSSQVARCQAG